MPGNYSKIKTVVTGEVITAADRNAEHDNHITNQTPAGTDDYSANTTEMQTITDPYPGGVESLATSLAGELERLRFLIKQITGADQWYIAPDNALLSTSSATYLRVNAINPDNTNPTSHALFLAEVGGTSAGDPYTLYGIPGGMNWSIGVDNSDNDKFKISMGNALGTNDFLFVDTSGNLSLVSGNLSLVSGRYSGRLENPTIQTFVKEEFFGAILSPPYFTGEMGWIYSAASLGIGGGTNHPGTFTIGTNSLAGNIAYFYQDGTTSSTHDFDTTMIIFPSDSSNISLLAGFIGAGQTGTMSPSSGIYFRKDSTETTWKGVCVSGGTSTTVDTNVTVSASWFKLRIRKSSGTVYFSVNGGSEYSISTNVPSVNIIPEFLVRTDTTSIKQLTVDYFDLYVSGIAR